VLVDQAAQFSQPISAKEGASGTDRDYEIRLENIGPLDR
jgi:hypothetical protein